MAGAIVLDISDKANPKMISRWDNSPPYFGFTHTVMPLFDRDLYVVTDECVQDDMADWPKLVGSSTPAAEETPFRSPPCLRLRPTYSGIGVDASGLTMSTRTYPRPTSWTSDRIIVGTFFNAGVRAYDISDPFQPREIGVLRAGSSAAFAHGHDPAQRRVHR